MSNENGERVGVGIKGEDSSKEQHLYPEEPEDETRREMASGRERKWSGSKRSLEGVRERQSEGGERSNEVRAGNH